MLKFRKMHGLGNDFIVLDCRNKGEILGAAQIRKMADRRRGVGFDQVVHMLLPKHDAADVFLDMYNADGSALEACGNATRCVADILMQEKGTKHCLIETIVGELACFRAENGLITVDMGIPQPEWQKIPLSKACDTLHLPLEGDPVGVSIGNPHCVFFVEDAEGVDLETLGPRFETDLLFPNRTNVEFVNIKNRQNLRMRVWERGTGITQACGTGACASVVAAIRRGLTDRKVTVTLDGGDLIIEWREEDNHLLMTGPVAYVFDGTLQAL